MGHRMENPNELSGFDIVAVDVSGNGFKTGASGRQRHDDHISDYTPGICRGILGRPILLRIQAGSHVDDAVLAKRCDRFSRTSIDLLQSTAGDDESAIGAI